jgi:hypothetical protein
VKPFFKDIEIADDGRIWASISTPSERYDPPQRTSRLTGAPISIIGWREPTIYNVFDPDGTYLGQVAVPYNTRLLVMRADLVWAVAHDQDDVHYVKRFRIAWQ